MPYIKPSSRHELDEAQLQLAGRYCETPGDLNYAFTVLVCGYLARHGLNYQHINDVVGAFEGSKLEFYRRIAVPYEDTKVIENGDVYHQGKA